MGGNFHLKLNIDSRPIANKYREGKVKRTLKRELKVPEIAEGQAFGSNSCSIGAIWCSVNPAKAGKQTNHLNLLSIVNISWISSITPIPLILAAA